MPTGFRLRQLSSKTLRVGAVVLVGMPVALFVLVFLSDAPAWVAWWGGAVLLYYFVLGAYVHARYGGAWSTSPREKS